jgi:RNA polymerase sporulation-specific sigma factor
MADGLLTVPSATEVNRLASPCNHTSANTFSFMQDEEVVHLARDGHDAAVEFIIGRYRSLVENKAKSYFVAGADRDDVIQEGMIGLYKAIRDYRSDKLTKFRPFAELCVTRQIITAVKTATRQKHVPLNAYVSLNRATGDDGCLMEYLPDRAAPSPESALVEHGLPENLQEMAQEVLSDLERGVLQCYLDGLSYREMSKRLSCHTKSIDNALQRVKKKIGLLLKD